MFKFIFALIGFFVLGKNLVGGFLGFIIGSVMDNFSDSKKNPNKNDDVFEYYKQRTSRPQQDFATMLIALSAAVLRADGKVLKVELDFVKSFFSQQFGPNFSVSHLQALKQFVEGGQIPLQQICNDIKLRTQVEVRLQLLHYLFGIAKADGSVSEIEINIIKQIAQLMDISQADFESIKNMFYRNTNSDYSVLGIENTATDEEIKKAYRQMAIRYHPDKVASMGEEYQKGAKEKFQKIQESYEAIKKQRGMN